MHKVLFFWSENQRLPAFCVLGLGDMRPPAGDDGQDAASHFQP